MSLSMNQTQPDFEKQALGDVIMSLTNDSISLRAQLLIERFKVATLEAAAAEVEKAKALAEQAKAAKADRAKAAKATAEAPAELAPVD